MDQVTFNEHCDSSKQSSFYVTYTTLCKEKNVPAILELIKNKYKLDFVADRIKVDQWEMICKSLDQDKTLELLAIRSRKSTPFENNRFTTIVPLMRSVSGCVKRNYIITTLALEGLPMTIDYIQTISIAIAQNSSLKYVSFARSKIMDDGCNVICCTVRDLPHIEKLNLSQCYLTATAANYISELIKFQTINRNSEGWMKSLRYREVDVDSVPGLKCLILNGNQFQDEGIESITSRLKEDMWMKAIELQNCDLTDVGGKAILDCLKFNKTLVVFDANHNYKISDKIHKKIQMTLNTEPDNYDSVPKITNSELREKIEFLEQRLQLEIFNRERADDLNVQLHRNFVRCDEELSEKSFEPPNGYRLINSSELNELYKEIEDLLQEKSHHEKDRYQTNDIKANITEQSGFGDTQSGFGDTITMPERNTYASFIPFTQKNETIKTFELNTSVNFTPYSQESSSVSSKLDDTDTMTLTSDDEVFNTSKQESAFEGYVACDQFNQEIRGNDNFKGTVECERNDLFSTVN